MIVASRTVEAVSRILIRQISLAPGLVGFMKSMLTYTLFNIASLGGLNKHGDSGHGGGPGVMSGQTTRKIPVIYNTAISTEPPTSTHPQLGGIPHYPKWGS